MNQCWGYAAGPELPWLVPKGLHGYHFTAWQHWYCLLVHGDASIWISCHPGNWVVLFLWGVRLRAEGKGAAFHHFTYPLGASVVVVLFGFVCFFFVSCCFSVYSDCTWAFCTAFLLWANRVSSSLNHRCLDDRQSPERARHELKKSVVLLFASGHTKYVFRCG